MSISLTSPWAGVTVNFRRHRRSGHSPDSSLLLAQREDADLIERARNGDKAAYGVLVRRYQDRLLSVALGLVGNREDAEDLAQETFLKAYRSLNSFRGDAGFYTWLYRILSNLSIDLSRRRYRQKERLVGERQDLDALQARKLSWGQHSTADIAYERAELARVIRQALDNLSPDHRAVIVLREIDGLSYEEISQAVGCSKGTVMSRLFHARKKLQTALRDVLPESMQATTVELRTLAKGGL